MGEAMGRIQTLATRGLFRSRDLVGISRNWLQFARDMGRLTAHGPGLWSHALYRPTAYELAQVRLPRAVFWGPSALWLLGALTREPEVLWIALGNKARLPRTLDPSTVIIRTRRLEQDLITLRPPGRLLTLRVYSRARAQADLDLHDCERKLTQAEVHFSVPRHAGLLTSGLPVHPHEAPPRIPDRGIAPEAEPGPCRGS
ncbi:MAG: hypothetical protein Q8L48_20795 [Archangium sp.]|nr:hypothetical protein [Archangium sp.]